MFDAASVARAIAVLKHLNIIVDFQLWLNIAAQHITLVLSPWLLSLSSFHFMISRCLRASSGITFPRLHHAASRQWLRLSLFTIRAISRTQQHATDLHFSKMVIPYFNMPACMMTTATCFGTFTSCTSQVKMALSTWHRFDDVIT